MALYSAFPKSLEPNILEWMHDGLTEHSDFTPEIFNISDHVGNPLRFHDTGGPKHIEASTPGATTPTVSKAKGYETVVAPQIYKSKMQTLLEDKRWVEYNDLMNNSQDLGRAVTQTVNTVGAGTFILGFTSTATSYGDGQELFSTQHTNVLGGSVQSNASSSGITLTEANLETGFNALRQQTTLGGKKLNVTAGNVVLMVPEALDKEAVIITGSQLRSATMDNDLNWYRGKISVFVNPFVGSDWESISGTSGSDTQWQLIARRENGLFFNYDARPAYTMWEDKDTDSFYTKVYMAIVAGWKNWRGVWGSKGDSLNYTS
jgi:hypothetical protein